MVYSACIMFFIGRVLISIKSFYKNYNNQQHDNMKNHYKWNNKNSRYILFVHYSFIIFYPYNYFMNFSKMSLHFTFVILEEESSRCPWGHASRGFEPQEFWGKEMGPRQGCGQEPVLWPYKVSSIINPFRKKGTNTLLPCLFIRKFKADKCLFSICISLLTQ